MKKQDMTLGEAAQTLGKMMDAIKLRKLVWSFGEQDFFMPLLTERNAKDIETLIAEPGVLEIALGRGFIFGDQLYRLTIGRSAKYFNGEKIIDRLLEAYTGAKVVRAVLEPDHVNTIRTEIRNAFVGLRFRAGNDAHNQEIGSNLRYLLEKAPEEIKAVTLAVMSREVCEDFKLMSEQKELTWGFMDGTAYSSYRIAYEVLQAGEKLGIDNERMIHEIDNNMIRDLFRKSLGKRALQEDPALPGAILQAAMANDGFLSIRQASREGNEALFSADYMQNLYTTLIASREFDAAITLLKLTRPYDELRASLKGRIAGTVELSYVYKEASTKPQVSVFLDVEAQTLTIAPRTSMSRIQLSLTDSDAGQTLKTKLARLTNGEQVRDGLKNYFESMVNNPETLSQTAQEAGAEPENVERVIRQVLGILNRPVDPTAA